MRMVQVSANVPNKTESGHLSSPPRENSKTSAGMWRAVFLEKLEFVCFGEVLNTTFIENAPDHLHRGPHLHALPTPTVLQCLIDDGVHMAQKKMQAT